MMLWGGVSCAIMEQISGNGLDIKVVVKDVYYLRNDYCNHLWFLCTLIFLNFANPILYAFLNNKYAHKQYYLLALLIPLTCSQFYYLCGNLTGVKGVLCCALVYYVLGFTLYKNKFIAIRKYKILLFFIAAISCQILYNYFVCNHPQLSHFGNSSDLTFSGYSSFFIVAATMAFMLFLSKMNLKENKFVSFVSKNTLGIYLVHWVVIRLLRSTAFFQGQPVVLFAIVSLVTLICVFLLSKTKLTRYIITT